MLLLEWLGKQWSHPAQGLTHAGQGQHAKVDSQRLGHGGDDDPHADVTVDNTQRPALPKPQHETPVSRLRQTLAFWIAFLDEHAWRRAQFSDLLSELLSPSWSLMPHRRQRASAMMPVLNPRMLSVEPVMTMKSSLFLRCCSNPIRGDQGRPSGGWSTFDARTVRIPGVLNVGIRREHEAEAQHLDPELGEEDYVKDQTDV